MTRGHCGSLRLQCDGLPPSTPRRFCRRTNTSHQFWMNLQAAYDLQCAEDAAGRAIARIKPLAATEVAAQE